MAPPAGTLRVGPYFLSLLGIIVVLYALVFLPGQSHTPKLGLDLEGGTQVVLRATTPDGKAPSKASLNEARTIINERVNGKGVAEAEVRTQGADQIIISIPGKNADISGIGTTAQLNFRPLCAMPFSASLGTAPASAASSASPTASPTPTDTAAADTASPSPSPSPSSTLDPTDAGCSTLPVAPVVQAAPSPSPSATPSGTESGTASDSASASPSPSPSETTAPVDPTTLYTGVTAEQAQALYELDCSRETSELDTAANADQLIVACSDDGSTKYLLGRVIVPGTQIDTATAQAPDQNNLQWAVNIKLKSAGDKAWAQWTAAHNSSDGSGQDTTANNYVAFVLDGKVISAPHTNSAISAGLSTQVTGNFTQASATSLANSLKYGALPLSFTTERSGSVSATLGTAQLKAGLIAGGIGLALVVIYSLLYYRALGFVTLASLAVSGVLIYALLVILGREMGFTLTLAGIAGFIVAVGITADSFVVLFERIKDEVHEGRTVRVAVPRAWVRARRTILSADTVSILAAVVLYYFASDQVRGFAFTLGLSTVVDVVLVFLFTHPLVSLLSRSPRFASARFSGLSAARVGGVAVREEPAMRRRPAAASAQQRASARGGGGTAVLERTEADTLVEDEDSLDDAGELVDDEFDGDAHLHDDLIESPDAPSPTDAEDASSSGSGTSAGTSAGGSAGGSRSGERPATTPVEGASAAERAAARRARLREQRESGEKGTD